MLSLEHVGHLGTLPLTIDVGLDCGMMSVQRVLGLKRGSVVRSIRPAGDNLDIRVGGRLIAYGEIVPLDGVTGVRIAHVVESL